MTATTAQLVVLTPEALRTLVSDAVADALGGAPGNAAPGLLDRASLARALGVSTSTVDRLGRVGLPCLLVCEAKRFELPAVLEWLRQRKGGQQ